MPPWGVVGANDTPQLYASILHAILAPFRYLAGQRRLDRPEWILRCLKTLMQDWGAERAVEQAGILILGPSQERPTKY